ncbi:MAG: branched-chain amino acid ABC transporter permease [Thermoproteus sp.]
MRGAFSVVPLALLAAYFLSPPYLKYEILFAMIISISILGASTLLDAGLVNFGFGMYVAVGAYAAALAYKYAGVVDVGEMLALAALSGVVAGALIGLATARFRGIFYALMNLAISMVIYGFLVKFYNITGGSDGISLYGLMLFGSPLRMEELALLSGILLLAASAFRQFYLSSALGRLAVGMRENELKLQSLGVDTNRLVVMLSVIAGLWGGIGGAMLGFLVTHISPDLSFWAYSALLVVGAITAELISPSYGFIAGAIIFRGLNVAAFYVGSYDLAIGLGLLAVYISMEVLSRLGRA